MEILAEGLSDLEKLLYAAVGGLMVGLILKVFPAIGSFVKERREDAIYLKPKLSVGVEETHLEKVGCPYMLLRVSSKGKRPAKIKRTTLCLKGFDAMPYFQQAHGTDFGYKPQGGNPDPDAVFFIHLLPLSKPNDQQIVVLERDDSCDFLLPVCMWGLDKFLDAPSENVYIRVTFFDESERRIMQGLSVQSVIRSMMNAYGHQEWPFNRELHIDFGVTVNSKSAPDLSHIGQVNPKPMRLEDETPPS